MVYPHCRRRFGSEQLVTQCLTCSGRSVCGAYSAASPCLTLSGTRVQKPDEDWGWGLRTTNRMGTPQQQPQVTQPIPRGSQQNHKNINTVNITSYLYIYYCAKHMWTNASSVEPQSLNGILWGKKWYDWVWHTDLCNGHWSECKHKTIWKSLASDNTRTRGKDIKLPLHITSQLDSENGQAAKSYYNELAYCHIALSQSIKMAVRHRSWHVFVQTQIEPNNNLRCIIQDNLIV